MDQYGNATKTLDSKCVNLMSVDADGLEKSTVNLEWQVGTETYTNKEFVSRRIKLWYLILSVEGANNKQQELGTVPLVATH